MKIAACVLLLSAFIAGCASPPPVKMQTRFVANEHDQYRQKGSSVIFGQGFLRQQGGGIVTCAGQDVYLYPATPFFREYFEHIISGRRVDSKSAGVGNPAYQEIIRKTQCDAQGNFMFGELPAGSWLVMTEVRWLAGKYRDGGSLLRMVSLAEGQRGKLLLSNNNLVLR